MVTGSDFGMQMYRTAFRYQGEYLNVCNTSGGPRPIPTSVLVMPAGHGEG